MQHETIKIVIQNDGDLRVEMPGLDAARLSYYRELFEEVFGKIKHETLASEQQPPSGVKIADSPQQELTNGV
jgi:hypothetical protein